MATQFQVFKYSALLIAALIVSNAFAETAMQETARPVVIELFTSQGCNSCPPAEEILGEYVNKPNALILAFHVDYWDYLGWQDPFALPVSAQRQRGYVQALRLNSAVTPQSVIDGRASIAGADRQRLAAALRQKQSGISPLLSRSGDTLSITLPESNAQYDVHLVSYQYEAATKVPHGENAGHILREHNIVRRFRTLSRWDGHAKTIDASLVDNPMGANRVAVIVQEPNQGAIVGAASLTL